MMSPVHRRLLVGVSNAGLALAVVLALVPVGMKTYGSWSEASERSRFEALRRSHRLHAVRISDPSLQADQTTEPALSDGARSGGSHGSHDWSPGTHPGSPLLFSRGAPGSSPHHERSRSHRRGQPTHDRSYAASSDGWQLCALQIPSIGVDAIVKEGLGNWKWIAGPAHEPESAFPGDGGNCIIAAHRNMWDAAFARLPRVRKGDIIDIDTVEGRCTYIVDSSQEVRTSDRRPLEETVEPRITLYTCVLPFNAQRRWVVQGHLKEGE